jgi:hypothetical protein
MALLGGGLTGDIWSTGAFSFESPLKDLLDSGHFTLEQLLAEDELLQEMRGVHPKLMAYFQTEAAVTKLVQYLILPPDEIDTGAVREKVNAADNGGNSAEGTDADTLATTSAASAASADEQHQVQQLPTQQVQEQHSNKPRPPGEWLAQHLESKAADGGNKSKTPQDDPEMKHIRFPYMACEIVCCEINGVLSALVDGYVVDGDDETDNMSEDEQQLQPAQPQRILDLFFSVLYDTDSGKLDDYRAGYFDKILSVLFRKRPLEMSAYINAGGAHGRPALMRAILNHLYSHSIMQIVQRLLLPQRPISTNNAEDGGENGPDDELLSDALDPNMNHDIDDGPRFECDWSEAPEALETLLDILMGNDESQAALASSAENDYSNDSSFSKKELLEEGRLNLSQNASEVLITIIQHSLLSSKTMLTLTLPENLGKVVTAATTLPVNTNYFSPHESLLTSAMNVLESLILQLGGYGAVGTMSVVLPVEEEQEGEYIAGAGVDQGTEILDGEPSTQYSDQDATKETNIAMQTDQANEENIEESFEVQNMEPLIADLSTMIEHLPRLLGNLAELLRHPSTAQWKSPMQYSKSEPQPLLGTSRLRIVRVLEAMVLLGDPEVDSYLVMSDCLETCLDLFWEFQWCSMLHQSVANLLVHVFEGGNARVDMQEYFIIRCNLLSRLMDSYLEMQVTPNIPGVVLCLKDLDLDTSGRAASSVGSDKGSSDHLPVSEDDVDAALEQESEAQVEGASAGKEAPATEIAEMTSVDQGSMEAVQFESRDNSSIGAGAPSQSFRLGYMGHVIIICQALVHASSEDADENQEENPDMEISEARKAADGDSSDGQDGGANGFPDVSREDTLQEPLLLAEMVKYHPAVERWHVFMSTTLASETSIQATPLGGFNASANGDPLHSHRPGLEEEDMFDDDGLTPPLPPRGMLGGGDVIDMDDNDLDIAASMISGVTFGRQNSAGSGGGDNDSDGGNSGNSGDSQRTYDSGETANSGSGYMFDDPLGKMKEGELGIELGKLMNYKAGEGKKEGKASETTADDTDEEENDSSSDEEPERERSNSDEDVKVMDLFAGNFSYGESDQPAGPQEGDSDAPDWSQEGDSDAPDWSNFANFDDAFVPSESNKDDDFGAFTSAENPASAPDAADPSASEGSTSTAEIDEMFGNFDHATLLEADDPVEEFEPFSSPSEEESRTIESPTTEDAALTEPSPEVDAVAMDVQPVTLSEEVTATTVEEETSQPETIGPEDSGPADDQSDGSVKEPSHAPENGSSEEPVETKELVHATENGSVEEPATD